MPQNTPLSIHIVPSKLLRIVLAASFAMALLPFLCSAQMIEWQADVGGNTNEAIFTAAPSPGGGYVVCGSSASGPSGNKTSGNFGLEDFWLVKLDANGNKQWDKTYGGSGSEESYSVQPTGDGGYVMCGYSYSGATGNKTNLAIGSGDAWVVKTDGSGNLEWERVFGGVAFDVFYIVRTNSDGGYIMVGQSYSGVGGTKTNANLGEGDFWLVKTDAAGNQLWERVFGGDMDEYPYALEPTRDGGYIMGGSSASGISGNKTTGNFGNYDYWIVKVDTNGIKQWERTYGGDGWDEVNALKQTSDGGYIVAGSSPSGISGNKQLPAFGFYDWWLLKLDENGDKQWETVLGGTNDSDYLNQVVETSDGGFLLAGTSWSNASGNKTNENIGMSDYWLVKVDSNGNKLWEQVFGGTDEDYPWFLQPAGDGGYLLAGHSESGMTGNKTSNSYGGFDAWVLKLASMDTVLPSLSIGSTTSNSVVVAWPTSATGFELQENAQLGSTNWVAPAESVQDDGTNKSILVQSPSGERYYRLIKSP